MAILFPAPPLFLILGSHWTRRMKRKSEGPDPHLADDVHPLPIDFEALLAGVSLRELHGWCCHSNRGQRPQAHPEPGNPTLIGKILGQSLEDARDPLYTPYHDPRILQLGEAMFKVRHLPQEVTPKHPAGSHGRDCLSSPLLTLGNPCLPPYLKGGFQGIVKGHNEVHSPLGP